MKSENTSIRLKRLLSERKLKQVDVLEMAKPYCIQHNVRLGKNDLSQYVNGKTEPGSDKLSILGLALNVSETWLMGYDVPMNRDYSPVTSHPDLMPVTTKKIPIIGEIACGEPIFAEQQYDAYAEADSNISADFCLKCKGDSMEGDGIRNGDIVFIRQQDSVNNGEIACVIIDDEATLKHVYFNDSGITLIASNPKFAPIVITEADARAIKILGKAVALSRIL